MSGEGRRRVAMGAMRATMGAVAAVLVGWGGWEVAGVLRANPDAMPGAAKSDKVRSLVLADRRRARPELARQDPCDPAQRDAHEPRPWPSSESEVLANPQGELGGHLPEFPRHPHGEDRRAHARRQDDGAGRRRGAENAAGVEGRRCLRGLRLRPGNGRDASLDRGCQARARSGSSLGPIEGMRSRLGRLLADLRRGSGADNPSTGPQRRSCRSVAPAADGEIEVTSKDGMKMIFGTKEDYLLQVARLDLLVDSSSRPDPAAQAGEPRPRRPQVPGVLRHGGARCWRSHPSTP